MAAASHVSSGIYGKVFGQPPFQGTNSGDAFANFIPLTTPAVMSFPTAGTVFHPVSPGQQVGNTTNYIYSVIEIVASGLNVEGDKWASNQSVATLATNAG